MKLDKPNLGRPGQRGAGDSGRLRPRRHHVRPRGEPARVPTNGATFGFSAFLGENWDKAATAEEN